MNESFGGTVSTRLIPSAFCYMYHASMHKTSFTVLDSTEVTITSHCENITEFTPNEINLVTHHLPFRGVILGHLLDINKHSDFKYKMST